MKDPCLAISLSPCGSLAPALVCRKGRESWAAFIEREDRFERPARRERERENLVGLIGSAITMNY